MKAPDNEKRWFKWFGELANGTICPKDFADLQQALREHPECRRLWNLHCDLEIDIADALAANSPDNTIAFPATTPPTALPTPKLTRYRWWAAAAAAAISIGVFSIFSLPKPSKETLVRIIENREATQPAGTLSWRNGDEVSIRTLELQSGDLRFSTNPGIDITATSPVSLEIISPMHIRVLSGKVTAEATPGFVIETTHARLVDLGTQFGVEVDPAAETRLVVFDGEVEVHNPSARSNQPLATVTEGRAISIGGSGLLLPVSHVITGPMVDAWQISSEPRHDSIISAVSDNVPETINQRFYPVFPGGLDEGVRAFPYQRDTPRWWGTRSGGFPEFLKGADFVQTLQRELNNPNLEITLQLDQPCDLFVFHESETQAPDWLLRDFRITDTELVLSPEPPPSVLPGDRSLQRLRIYHVWTRRIDAPGLVTLGSIHRETLTSPPHYMYGIAAKALRSASN
jgi:ferric-dicitrate binding protein FerR (iron transport regulator)